MNGPSETLFLESVDTFAINKSGNELFKLMHSTIQRISKENVTQAITRSIYTHISDGEVLGEKSKKIFRSPCTTHCLDT